SRRRATSSGQMASWRRWYSSSMPGLSCILKAYFSTASSSLLTLRHAETIVLGVPVDERGLLGRSQGDDRGAGGNAGGDLGEPAGEVVRAALHVAADEDAAAGQGEDRRYRPPRGGGL